MMAPDQDQRMEPADGQLRGRARDFLHRSAQGIRRRFREQFVGQDPGRYFDRPDLPCNGSPTANRRLRPLRPECTMQHISTNSSIIGNGAGTSSARCTDDCPFPCPLTYRPRSPRTKSKAPGTDKDSYQDSGIDVKMSTMSSEKDNFCNGNITNDDFALSSSRWSRRPPCPYTAIIIPRRPEPAPGPFTPRLPWPRLSIPDPIRVSLSTHGVPDMSSFFSQISSCTNSDRIHYIDELHRIAPQPEECAQALGDFYADNEEAMPVRKPCEVKVERVRIAEERGRTSAQERFAGRNFKGGEKGEGFSMRENREDGEDYGEGMREMVVGPMGEEVGLDDRDAMEHGLEQHLDRSSSQQVEERNEQEAVNVGQEDIRQPLLESAPGRNDRADFQSPGDAKIGSCEEKTLWASKIRQEVKLKLWEAGLYKRGEKHYCDKAKKGKRASMRDGT